MKTKIFTISSLILLTLTSVSPVSALDVQVDPANRLLPTKASGLRQEFKGIKLPSVGEPRQDSDKANVRSKEFNIKNIKTNISKLTGTPAPTVKAELKAEAKAERQSALLEAKKKVVTKIYENLKASLEKRYNTLSEVLKKIQDKAAEKQAAGKDISAVGKLIDQIKTEQANYAVSMANLKNKFDQVIASDKPWTMVSDLRASAKKVETNLQTIRKLETEALRLIVKL